MNLRTALEIANCYPDQILIDAAQNDNTKKWSAFIYRLKGDDIHKLMLSTNDSFESEDEAKKYMIAVSNQAIELINGKKGDT